MSSQPNASRTPEVTLEWDKSERQRARNRMNQRNYRRRKSEQQLKQKEKGRGKSASRSPATQSTSISATTPEESNGPNHGESTAGPFQYSIQAAPWSTQNRSFESMLTLPGMIETAISLAALSWEEPRIDPTDLPHNPLELSTRREDRQTSRNLEHQPDLSDLSSQIQNFAWSTSPLLNPQLSGSDIGATSGRGKTTLHLAAENSHNQCVQVLILHGANPNLKDAEGYTALHIAAEHGHLDIIATLLESGCDLNEVTYSGRTALHLAAENDHFEVVDQLLRAGCDPNIQISDT